MLAAPSVGKPVAIPETEAEAGSAAPLASVVPDGRAASEGTVFTAGITGDSGIPDGNFDWPDVGVTVDLVGVVVPEAVDAVATADDVVALTALLAKPGSMSVSEARWILRMLPDLSAPCHCQTPSRHSSGRHRQAAIAYQSVS